MKAYITRRINGDFVLGIVRANSKERAEELLKQGESYDENKDLDGAIADTMGVLDVEGYHSDALERWFLCPTNILGDPPATDGSVQRRLSGGEDLAH